MFKSISRLLKSSDFYKGLELTTAILVVLGVAYFLDAVNIGVGLVMGMFICAPANVRGSIRHRIFGMLAATVLGTIVTIIISFAAFNALVFIPVLAALVFLISYISVYGFRASLVSFAGLLSIFLSFAHPKQGIDILFHSGLIFSGGLLYVLFSYISHLIIHKRHTEEIMAECMQLTAKYLRVRAEYALDVNNQKKMRERLFKLQTDLNTQHETLREILLSSRRKSGTSNFARRQVLIFIELIDILELAIANLPNIYKIHKVYASQHQRMKPFIAIIFGLADRLDELSAFKKRKGNSAGGDSIEKLLIAAKESISEFQKASNSTGDREGVLLMQNIFSYLQNQAQKIGIIQKVIDNLYERDQVLPRKDSLKFITQQDYDRRTLIDNFNFGSPIFRLSLRLTVTVLIGYIVGQLFNFQNAYWILITIVVIMRPGYGLTKERSLHRVYGTLIGGAIAVAIVFITQNLMVYGILAIISFVLAFSLVQKNYKSSAAFITLSIVFIYALIQPDPLNVVQFRVLDTVTGAALAIIANLFLWPSWEIENIQGFILKTIEANKKYIEEINGFYHHTDHSNPEYKLSRKNAFLAIGNLHAAFQRMNQEPKSRQKNISTIYEVVVLNHTILSLTASLGTFMRNHPTTKASGHFENYIKGICRNLDLAGNMLENKAGEEVEDVKEITDAQHYLDERYKQLTELQLDNATSDSQAKSTEQLREVQFISEQLKWLYTLSGNLVKSLWSIKTMPAK